MISVLKADVHFCGKVLTPSRIGGNLVANASTATDRVENSHYKATPRHVT